MKKKGSNGIPKPLSAVIKILIVLAAVFVFSVLNHFFIKFNPPKTAFNEDEIVPVEEATGQQPAEQINSARAAVIPDTSNTSSQTDEAMKEKTEEKAEKSKKKDKKKKKNKKSKDSEKKKESDAKKKTKK